MKIAISITTHNRYDVFKNTYDYILKYLPEGATICVIDDASDVPVKEATFRFDENVGIAASKNMGFKLMGNADYYFCFDDDTYPIVKDWHLPYINSGLNHAMMIWGNLANGMSTNNRIIKKKDGLVYWKNPCGCMLFYTKKAIEAVGGMDTRFGVWGGDHQQHSQRIFNNKLTPYPFIDIPDSTKLFYAHDYYMSCDRSVSKEIRKAVIPKVMRLLAATKFSKEYIPYK